MCYQLLHVIDFLFVNLPTLKIYKLAVSNFLSLGEIRAEATGGQAEQPIQRLRRPLWNAFLFKLKNNNNSNNKKPQRLMTGPSDPRASSVISRFQLKGCQKEEPPSKHKCVNCACQGLEAPAWSLPRAPSQMDHVPIADGCRDAHGHPRAQKHAVCPHPASLPLLTHAAAFIPLQRDSLSSLFASWH